MSWVAVDAKGEEYVYSKNPFKALGCSFWSVSDWSESLVCLPKGSIKKLIGRDLTWEDEPVELK